MDFDDAALWLGRAGPQAAPDRIVAHVGFCGSSLLAQALDATGVCQSYKEPQVVTDVSVLKTLERPFFCSTSDWADLIAIVRSQFRKSFGALTPVLKPSNWSVNLLPELCGAETRVVFMTSEPREYLTAVLRGGNERVRFMLSFIQKLRNDFDGVNEAVSAVETDAGGESWQVVLRSALIALAAQEQMFRQVAEGLPTGNWLTLDGRKLLDTPEEWLARIANTLALPVRRSHRRRAIREAFAASSKQPWAAFDAGAHAASNKRVLDVFQREIDTALEWGARRLAPMV